MDIKSYLLGKKSGGGGKLQEKTITENGEHTADEGYDGLSKVNVFVPAPEGDTLTEFLTVRGMQGLFMGKIGIVNIGYNDQEVAELVPKLPAIASTNFSYMFMDNKSLTTVPLFDTSNATSMYAMFNGCTALTTVPLFDTSRVTKMSSMLSGCTALTTVPLFDTSKGTNMESMFNGCTALTTVPLFDTSRVTNMGYIFKKCTSLTTVPSFDIRRVTEASYMFMDCYALTEIRIRNIKTNLQVGSGTSYGHLLTVDSLVHLIYELRDTGSSKTLTVGNANLEKLANVYVKTIEITDEMRAEDDLVDEKLPFVVCESTDEGAMLITDYVLEKNWTLK